MDQKLRHKSQMFLRTEFFYFGRKNTENLSFKNGHFSTISGHFFANYINIFHKTGIPTIILRCLTCLNLNWIKSLFLVFPKLHEIDKNWLIYETLFSSNFMNIFLNRLLWRHLVQHIFKVLAWEIWNMKFEFAKKIIPKS